MTAKALIKTAELTRLARLAKLENVTVEIETNGVIIRIRPDYTQEPPAPTVVYDL